jgi:hypothetical protein
MFIIKKKFYLEHINNICKIQENFIDNIDFYNIQFYNNMTVDNHILLYFLNKQSQTNIIIKIINNGIFDISASNRNKQNINYVDIVSILYKLFEINCINSELIENISVNLIQIYYNLFIDFNIMNKILNNFDPIHLRYSAIDGGKEDDICHKYFYSENNIYPPNSNKEYAILLSHLNCIEKFCYIKHKEYNIGLICEDDLSLDFMKYWDKDISEIISGAPDDWEIIMLGYFYIDLDIPETYNRWNNQWSAIAYLVNGTVEKKIKSMKKDNKWIIHTPDDGRKTLYMAHWENGKWNWDKQFHWP